MCLQFLLIWAQFPAKAFLSPFLRPTIADTANSCAETLSGFGLLSVFLNIIELLYHHST